MLWIVILGILLILIIAIIITMFKIIKGSNDIQESKERSSSRARGRENSRGSGNRSDRRDTNDRKNPREVGYKSRKKPRREERDYNQRPSKDKRPSENMARGSDGPKRRWKVILVDVTTHEEHEFIFSDVIGVGRAFVKEGYEDYLVINDPKVSKRHCSIFTDGDNLYIQDEGSSNYTFVNNDKVNRPTMIQKEDIIGIGNTELEVFKVFRESR